MSLPRYEKYKDSGVEWLWDVPCHWDVLPIRRVSTAVQTGRTPGSENPSTDVIEGLVWFTPGDFGTSLRLSDSARKICSDSSAAGEVQLFPAGSVLIVGIGATLGKVGFATGPCSANQQINVVIPNHRIDSCFLAYSLVVKADVMRYLSNASTIGIMNQEKTKEIWLSVPPMSEQSAIATFLDHETTKIDALIAEQQRLIDLLREKRQAAISHAVTQGLNPAAPIKPSGIEWLGDIPAPWVVTKLGRVAFMQEGPGLRTWQFTDEGTRVICVTNIADGRIDFSLLEKFISSDEYNLSYRHFTVRRGDILLSSSGNSWGKVAIYDGEEAVILNTSTIRLNEAVDGRLLRKFIEVLLQSDMVREQLGLAMTGSCQPNFGPSHLRSVVVVVPSLSEQESILEHVSCATAKLDAMTAQAQSAITLLQERRTALISAAVTGKIDVRSLAR